MPPTIRRSTARDLPTLTPLQVLERTRRRAERALQDAATAAADAATAQTTASAAGTAAATAQTDINSTLAGTKAFTGLLVGATNVKPFLDKTDGSKLTDSTALNDSLVTTAKVAAENVTLARTNRQSVAENWTAESDERTICSVLNVTPKRGAININATLRAVILGGIEGRVRIRRDGTEKLLVAVSSATTAEPITFLDDTVVANTEYDYTLTFQPASSATAEVKDGAMTLVVLSG